jgi:hypothetical protein
MPITFECAHCKSSISAAAGAGGSTVQCPYCSGNNQVPEPQPVAEVVAEVVPEEVLELDDEPGDRADAPPAEPTKPWEHRRPSGGPWRAPTGEWGDFGTGCQYVKWGVLFELGTAVLGFVLLELLLLDAEAVIRLPDAVQSGEVLPALFLPLLAGTFLSAVGRVMMVRVPAHTPGAAILTVAAGLNWLRFILIVAAVVLYILGFNEPGKAGRGPYFDNGLRMCLLAGCVALITDLSAIPAMAVVGGEIPSWALRTRAALVTFVLQLLAALWIAMVVSAASSAAVRELVPGVGAPQGGAAPPQRPGRPGRIAVLTVLITVLFALQAGYYYLQYLLYSTGQDAGQSGEDRDP